MTRQKIIHEVLIRYSLSGQFQGAHHQFLERGVDDQGGVLFERLLPASPFGSDPDFPASALLGQVTSDALAAAGVNAAAADALQTARQELETARQEAAQAAATIAQLQEALNTATNPPPPPPRPPGKWWATSVSFLSEFTAAELQAVHTCQVPEITRLLLILLTWPSEVWAADSRIIDGMAALVTVGILTDERKNQILSP